MATIDFASSIIAVQLGRETTYATAVAANKKFPTLSLDLTAAANIATYTAQGTLVPVGTVLGEEWVEVTGKGPLDYNELAYLFDMVLAAQATGTQVSTSAAYKWVFTPAPSSHTATGSYTMEFGDATQGANNWQVPGVKVHDVTLKLNRKTVDLDIKGIAQRLVTGFTMTGSPTTITKQSVSPNAIDVILARNWADLPLMGPLARAFMCDVSTTNRTMPVWPLRSTALSFASTVDGKVKADVKLTLGSDADATQFLTGVRAGTRFFIRVRSIGNTIATQTAVSPGAAPVGTPGTSGTLAAGTYNVGYTYVNAAGGEGTISATAAVVTTGTTGSIAITTITPPAGAVSVNWYMSVSVGSSTLARIKSNNGAGFTITALPLTGAENPPTVDNTGNFQYSLIYDVPVEVATINKYADHEGVYASEVGFTIVNDGVSGNWTQATVVNALSAL